MKSSEGNSNNDNNQANDQSSNGRRLDDDDSEFANLVISSIEKGIESLISYASSKSLAGFMDYLEEKLGANSDNIDNYYKDIGDNYYVKNYIGFRNNEDLDNFLKYDFNLHRRLFPNKICGIFSIICLVVFFVLVIMSFASLIVTCDKEKDLALILLLISIFTSLVILLGFLIYSSTIYKNIYKSKRLSILNGIISDDFINGLIKEYISMFNNRGPIIATIVISSLSIFFNLLSLIILCANKD